jgi:hypothetical protein
MVVGGLLLLLLLVSVIRWRRLVSVIRWRRLVSVGDIPLAIVIYRFVRCRR